MVGRGGGCNVYQTILGFFGLLLVHFSGVFFCSINHLWDQLQDKQLQLHFKFSMFCYRRTECWELTTLAWKLLNSWKINCKIFLTEGIQHFAGCCFLSLSVPLWSHVQFFIYIVILEKLFIPLKVYYILKLFFNI